MSLIYKANFSDFSVFHSVDEKPNQSDFQMHIHGENEIFLFISGNATYLVEGNEYPLTPGSILIMRRSESHAVNFLGDEPYERYVINFSDSFVNSIDPEHRLLAPFYDRALGIANLYKPDAFARNKNGYYFKEMCRDDGDSYEKRIRAATNLFALLADISQAQKIKAETVRSELASKIIDYINNHIFEELSITIVANRFYMSPSQIERVFKKATHSSVWQYILAKRLAAAQSMIMDGASAYLACEACGFGDYSAFYRAYVKKYGIPPNAPTKK